MKNNILITTLTIIVLTLLVIVTLGIYKLKETENKLKETIYIQEESVKDILSLKYQIQDDYLVRSISSNKKEYSGNLLKGFKLNIEYEVRIKLIDENLNYIVEFKNIPPYEDFENRLKNLSVVFFDKDNFILLEIDLSKPTKQYVNSEKFYSSGKIELSSEMYELIDFCHFRIHSLSEEEYLLEEQTKNKSLEDWSSFLFNGMSKVQVISLIGEPSSTEENEESLNLNYDLKDSYYQLTFSLNDMLINFEEIPRVKSLDEIKWETLRRGISKSLVRNILGIPDEESFIGDGKIKYSYNKYGPNSIVIFDKDGKVIDFTRKTIVRLTESEIINKDLLMKDLNQNRTKENF